MCVTPFASKTLALIGYIENPRRVFMFCKNVMYGLTYQEIS